MDHDPRLCQKFTTLTDGCPTQTAAVLYGYSADPYKNVTDTYEYDYGGGPAPSTSCQAVSGGWTRHTNTVFNTSASYTSINLVKLPQETKVFGGSNDLYADTKLRLRRIQQPGHIRRGACYFVRLEIASRIQPMDPAQHGSEVALLVSLGGLVLELWGGFLLGGKICSRFEKENSSSKKWR